MENVIVTQVVLFAIGTLFVSILIVGAPLHCGGIFVLLPEPELLSGLSQLVNTRVVISTNTTAKKLFSIEYFVFMTTP
jgi:hypothetical protein